MRLIHFLSLMTVLSAVFPFSLSGCGSNNTQPLLPPAGNQPGQAGAVQNGTWGGMGARATVTGSGATFLFTCAYGSTTQPLNLDSLGHFSVTGAYARTGGPIIAGDPRHYPAAYSGTVSGNTMTLMVNYTDFTGNPQSQDYSLTFNKTGTVSTFCAQ